MKIHTIEKIINLDNVIEDIINTMGYTLFDYKKVELELRANVGVYKYKLGDIADEILFNSMLGQLFLYDSLIEKIYNDKSIEDGCCKYTITLHT